MKDYESIVLGKEEHFGHEWKVVISVDDDGMLGLFIKNIDESDIIDTDADLGNGKDGEELGIRFTTEDIEKEYRESGLQ